MATSGSLANTERASMDFCVIYNPAAGRGRAQRLVQRLFRRRDGIQLWPTREPGQGAALARRALEAGFRRVVAAGGDGTVHEVANGILQSHCDDVVFGVWPIGSANDYAYALGVHGDWPLDPHAFEKVKVQAVDIGRVSGQGRERYFVNGLGLGFNSAVTLESRAIPHLRGMALYGVAFLRAVWRHYRFPNLSITTNERTVERPTLALTVNLGQREGGFLVTPHASLIDGLFDVVQAGAISRWTALRMLPKIATGNLPRDHNLIRQSQCDRLKIQCDEPLRIHIDGEFFCLDEDGIHEVKVELLPKRLRVLAGARSAPKTPRRGLT
jgi:YegS/Rv2252/BmrU family lipid kinase